MKCPYGQVGSAQVGWFVATKPDVYKAWGGEIFVTQCDADYRVAKLNLSDRKNTWKAYRCFVCVCEEKP